MGFFVQIGTVPIALPGTTEHNRRVVLGTTPNDHRAIRM